jgi:hypothetical protein
VRADGGWDSIGGWTALGLGVSVLILLLKAETHLVLLARARSGQPLAEEEPADAPVTGSGRFRLRQGDRLLPAVRPFQTVEASLLVFAAAVADAARVDLLGSRVLLAVLGCAGLLAVTGHLLALIASGRLR